MFRSLTSKKYKKEDRQQRLLSRMPNTLFTSCTFLSYVFKLLGFQMSTLLSRHTSMQAISGQCLRKKKKKELCLQHLLQCTADKPECR